MRCPWSPLNHPSLKNRKFLFAMFTLTLEQRAVVWGGFQAESFVTPSLSLRCGVLSLAFLLIDGETEVGKEECIQRRTASGKTCAISADGTCCWFSCPRPTLTQRLMSVLCVCWVRGAKGHHSPSERLDQHRPQPPQASPPGSHRKQGWCARSPGPPQGGPGRSVQVRCS